MAEKFTSSSDGPVTDEQNLYKSAVDMESGTNNPHYEAWLAAMSAENKNSTSQIKANGDVKTKIGILWFVGTVCVLLILIGGYSLIVNPASAKDVWVITGPIISSAITGTVAYFTGDKNS